MEHPFVVAIKCDRANRAAIIDHGGLRVHHTAVGRGTHFCGDRHQACIEIGIFIVNVLAPGPIDQVGYLRRIRKIQCCCSDGQIGAIEAGQ
jgi:hypothetical protein